MLPFFRCWRIHRHDKSFSRCHFCLPCEQRRTARFTMQTSTKSFTLARFQTHDSASCRGLSTFWGFHIVPHEASISLTIGTVFAFNYNWWELNPQPFVSKTNAQPLSYSCSVLRPTYRDVQCQWFHSLLRNKMPHTLCLSLADTWRYFKTVSLY